MGYTVMVIGRVLVFGLVMGGLGFAGGWCLWGGPGVGAVKFERKRDVVVAKDDGGMAGVFGKWAGADDLRGAAIAFCVLDEDGALAYGSPLAETALCPASALKTLTGGAAYGLLGEGFRFETVLLAGGGISREGVIAGDLILKGGGDPTLMEGDLLALADGAVARGLKRVMGSLRVDDSVFPKAPVSDHWVWGDLGNAYGAGAYGLNVGRNAIRLVFDGGARQGDAAEWLRSEPDVYDALDWQMEVGTGPAGSGDRVMIHSAPYGRRVEARGTVPLGAKGFVVRGALPDPPGFAREFLMNALVGRGVVFSDELVAILPGVKLARHESVPLAEIVDHMQKESDNLEAQCFFLTMGLKAGREPETVLKEYWEGMGVAFEGLRLIDGSGLARATMIRAVDLARVNYLARKSPYGERFIESLPGNEVVRSKRGAMSGVRTEVGFVKRGGSEYTFALMGNGLGGVDFWKLREGLLDGIGRVGVDRPGSGE